jgi:hypothetical protein
MKSQETKEAERTAPDTCTAAPLPMVAPLRMRTLEAGGARGGGRGEGRGRAGRAVLQSQPRAEQCRRRVLEESHAQVARGGPSCGTARAASITPLSPLAAERPPHPTPPHTPKRPAPAALPENAAFCWMRKRGWGAPLRSMMHLEPKPEHCGERGTQARRRKQRRVVAGGRQPGGTCFSWCGGAGLGRQGRVRGGRGAATAHLGHYGQAKNDVGGRAQPPAPAGGHLRWAGGWAGGWASHNKFASPSLHPQDAHC